MYVSIPHTMHIHRIRLHTQPTSASIELASTPITITLPDGKQVKGETNRTSPYDVAKDIRFAHCLPVS
jgi:hypothetical protein